MRYTGQGDGFKAFLESRDIVFRRGDTSVRMAFVGGRENPAMVAESSIGATANYLFGSDPSRWIKDLALFSAVRYREEWKGIDVVYRGRGSDARVEYVMQRGATAEDIRLRFDGKSEVAPDGSLQIANKSGSFNAAPPVLYFPGGTSDSSAVDGEYLQYPDGAIGVRVGSHNPRVQGEVPPGVHSSSMPFSGYLGGSGQSTVTSVAVDAYYNVVTAGWTTSAGLPASAGQQKTYGGGVDAFVAVFSPAGGSLLYCTYLGGSGDDRAFGVTVDSSRNIYLTGWTSSSNFPLVTPIQRKLGGTRDAFVAKLNPTLNSLTFSTYLGGSGMDVGYGIALDSTGAPVIAGDTTSTNLPVTAGVLQSVLPGSQNTFVAKLTTAGTALSLMTYLGGNATEHATSVALDTSNNIYVGGSTYSTTFPVRNAFQPVSGGGQDGFITELTPTASTLIFSSYLGGIGGSPGAPEQVNSLQISSSTGVLFVGGVTSSTNFPTTSGVFQPAFGGGLTDGFIAKINVNLYKILVCSFVGGSGEDSVQAIALDSFHYLYATGYTTSDDFPTVSASQPSNAGGLDAFALKTGFVSLYWSTYFGGSGNESGNAIAVDSLFNAVVAGSSSSSSLPIKGSVGTWSGSQLSSFLTKFSPSYTFALASAPAYIEDIWHNTGYNGSNITLQSSSFGLAGDLPIVGDWTGTGVKRLGSFRNGVWYLDINGNGVYDAGDQTVAFGQAGDVPVVGDWNGTGKIKLGLFRQGTFILDLSGHLSGVPTGLSDAQFTYGQAGDLPVVADWNQSGTAKVGIFRNGLWLVDSTGSRIYSSAVTYQYGQAGDIPVVGDWRGSGAANLGVYRSGLWILDYNGYYTLRSPTSTYNFVFAFGGGSYVPLIM